MPKDKEVEDKAKAAIINQKQEKPDRDNTKIKDDKKADKKADKKKVSKKQFANVARLYLTGTITFGGKKDIVWENIRAYLFDIEVKNYDAVVLMVDSPGGIASVAFDVLAGIKRLKKIRKDLKVYCLVNNIAASGGMLIAMGADKIYAYPSSIVGSIGTIAGKPVLGKTLNKIGISYDSVMVGDKAEIYSSLRSFNEQERKMLLRNTMDIQEAFNETVAKGRRLSLEDVKKLATGKVWSAKAGIKLGLVDGIGGQDELYANMFKDLNAEKLVMVDYPQAIDIKSLVKEFISSKFLSKSSLKEGVKKVEKSIKSVMEEETKIKMIAKPF